MNTDGYTRCDWRMRGGFLEIRVPWEPEPVMMPSKLAKPDVGHVLWDVWARQDGTGTSIATHFVRLPLNDLFCHFLVPQLAKAKEREQVVAKYGLDYRFRSRARSSGRVVASPRYSTIRT